MHPITSSKQIGATLTSSRKFLKLTQATVASRLDLSQNRISELEARPGTLTVEQLLALLNVLGLEMTITSRTTGKRNVEW